MTRKKTHTGGHPIAAATAAACSPAMSVSCSRMIGGGRGGVPSVCTLPGGVSERRVCCESEPSPAPRAAESGERPGVR